MTLWRISNYHALDGEGGLRASARWHTRGHRVVYCAPNPATALVEVLVHAEIPFDALPTEYRYLEIDAPGAVAVHNIPATRLGSDWHDDLELTREIGDEWLEEGRSALLSVPSVIVPATWNVLINPRHPDAQQVRITRIHNHPADRRLFQ